MSLQTNVKPHLLRFSLIRTRLTLWLVTILVIGMLTFVLTALVVANTLLQHQNQVRLQQTVLSLSTALAQEPDVNLSAVRSELDAFGTPENYLQYQNQQGVPIASSSNMGRLVLPLSQLRPAITANRVDVLVFQSTSFFMYGHAVVTRGQIQGYILGAHTVTDSESNSCNKSHCYFCALSGTIKANSGAFDATLDFASIVADTTDQTRLLPDYDSGHHLHPNAKGGRALADAVDLAALAAAL